MCKHCYTYAELSSTLKDALGIQGRFIASLTNAWELANVVVDNFINKDDEKWYETKLSLWNMGDITIGKEIVCGKDDFPDNYWEVYENVVVKGCNIYKITDEIALSIGL